MEKMKDQNGSRMLDDQELEQVNGGQYVSIPYNVDVYRYNSRTDQMKCAETIESGKAFPVLETIQKVVNGITYVTLDRSNSWVRLDQVEKYLR